MAIIIDNIRPLPDTPCLANLLSHFFSKMPVSIPFPFLGKPKPYIYNLLSSIYYLLSSYQAHEEELATPIAKMIIDNNYGCNPRVLDATSLHLHIVDEAVGTKKLISTCVFFQRDRGRM